MALYLLLLAVLHPSKALVDALFHAHRLEWVRAGNYFFTQPMPDGVAFPYAIALYVVASPWMALTRDHVALLRIVVCTAHVLDRPAALCGRASVAGTTGWPAHWRWCSGA